MWFFSKKKAPVVVPLSRVVHDLRVIMQQQQVDFETYELERLQRFFCADGSPVMQRFRLGDGVEIAIPLIMMVHHTLLGIHELKLSFYLPANSLELDALQKEYADIGDDFFMIEFPAPGKTHEPVTIHIVLKRHG